MAADKSDAPAGDLQRRFESRKQVQTQRGGGAENSMRLVRPAAAMPTPPAGGGKGGASPPAENKNARPLPGWVVPVEYAHVHPRDGAAAGPDLQETVLWSPALRADGGKAQASFDLSDSLTTYRVLVYGHDADGRLGVVQGKLEAGPPALPAEKSGKTK